jgi:hypothetical protein
MKRKYFVLIVLILILLSLFFIQFGWKEASVFEVGELNLEREQIKKLFLNNSLHEFE